MDLSLNLKGVISQRLIPRADGKGRVPAVEILINTPLIKKLLHEGRTSELYEHVQTGEYYGMLTFNQSLIKLVQDDMISYQTAIDYADSPEELRLAYEGMTSGSNAQTMDSSMQFSTGSGY